MRVVLRCVSSALCCLPICRKVGRSSGICSCLRFLPSALRPCSKAAVVGVGLAPLSRGSRTGSLAPRRSLHCQHDRLRVIDDSAAHGAGLACARLGSRRCTAAKPQHVCLPSVRLEREVLAELRERTLELQKTLLTQFCVFCCVSNVRCANSHHFGSRGRLVWVFSF